MDLNIYVPHNKEDSKCWQVFSPFQAGWQGDTHVENDYEYHGGIGMFWGFVGKNEQMIHQYIKNRQRWLFSDMPYFGRWSALKEGAMPDEEFYWRIIPNECHASVLTTTYAQDRWDKHKIKMKPWKTNGTEIIICPSSETMTQYHLRMSVQEWIDTVKTGLSLMTDRPIRVRYKPRANGTSGPDAALIPFKEDVKNAWAVVTCVSMAGVEAVIEGIPVYNTCSFSPTASLGNWAMQGDFNQTIIDKPILKDRMPLMKMLSYSQFTPKEMKSGYAREILSERFKYAR